MPGHEYFEELCALAIAGEVSAHEMEEVQRHLNECTTCKEAYRDYATLVNEHLPAAHPGGLRLQAEAVPVMISKLRQAVLARVVGEGLHVSAEALADRPNHDSRAKAWLTGVRWAIRARLPRIVAATSVATVIIAGALLVGRLSKYRQQTAQLAASQRELVDVSQQLRQQLEHTEETRASSEQPRMELAQQITASKERAAQLSGEHQKDLDVIRELESRIAQITVDKMMLAQHAEESNKTLASLREELEQTRSTASDRESQIVAQQYRINDLFAQLETQKAGLDRERQLLAADRDIRDLMSARNLHIIDVHDQAAYGEARPFGRIFLTEGKQLIFYAYDLDKAKAKNASFQVWGQRDDGSKTAVNLGIFYVDDQKQSRWTLRVEDPSLLQAIESVFVTVEPSGGTKKPSGKKLMYAYLRNPINHP